MEVEGRIESVPGERMGTAPSPGVNANPTADGDAAIVVATPGGQPSGSNDDDAVDDDDEGRHRLQRKAQDEKKQRENELAIRKEKMDRAELAMLTEKLKNSELRINAATQWAARLEASFEEKRKTFEDWKRENFDNAPQAQVISFGFYFEDNTVEKAC